MRLGELLLQKGAITREELQTALHEQRRFGGKLGTNLFQLGYIEVDTVALALGEQLKMPPVLCEHVTQLDRKVLSVFSPKVVSSYKAMPIALTSTKPARVIVACVDPNTVPREELAFAAGSRIELWVAPESLFQECMERYFGAAPMPDRYIALRKFNAQQKRQPTGVQAEAQRAAKAAAAAAAAAAMAPKTAAAEKPAAAGPPPKKVGSRVLSPPPPPPNARAAGQAAAPLEAPARRTLDMPAPAPSVREPPPAPPAPARRELEAPAPLGFVPAPAPAAFVPPPVAFVPPPAAPFVPAPTPRAAPVAFELEPPPPMPPQMAPQMPVNLYEAPAMRAPAVPQVEVAFADQEPSGIMITAAMAELADGRSGDSLPAPALDASLELQSEAAPPMLVGTQPPPEEDWDVPEPPPEDRPVTAPPGALRPVIDLTQSQTLLEMATGKEQIGRVLEDWLRSTFGCGLVLVVKGDMAMGWKGFFPDAEDLVDAVSIPLSKPTMFGVAYESRTMFHGAPPAEGAQLQERLWKLLHCTAPTEVLVAPVVLGKRVVNLLYAHAEDGSPLTEAMLADAQKICADAAAAYARLIDKDRKKR